MAKKPFDMGLGTGEAVGTSRRTLAELDVEGLGNFPLERVATVGRSPDSNVVLNVRSVSRHHARIFYEGGHFWIKDLDSGNGTSVNGKRVMLQMLSDNDRVSFGEASAVFRTSTRTPGPALIARDPLEGSDGLPQDGTPTGGLKGAFPDLKPVAPDADATIEDVAPAQDSSALRERIQVLERENNALRNEISQLRSTDLARENERLKKLTGQLERALADSNVRIRNLQERLEQK